MCVCIKCVFFLPWTVLFEYCATGVREAVRGVYTPGFLLFLHQGQQWSHRAVNRNQNPIIVTRIWPLVLKQTEKCLSVWPWAHQLLDLDLEHGMHSDDEGRRRTQHLQQSRWEDGDVGVTVVQMRVRQPQSTSSRC